MLRQSNRGISFARNAGLQNRRSEVVALLDADDLWLPQHLANLGRAYQLVPEAVVVFGDSRYFGDPRSRTDLLAQQVTLPMSEAVVEGRYHRLSDQVFDQSLPGQFFPVSASSFRMDVGHPEPRFDTELPVGEDRYFYLHMARRGRFVFCDEQSARTRRHEHNTTHHLKAAWLHETALRLLAKLRHDPVLALTPRELSIVDGVAQRTAAALLRASSEAGLRDYWRRCRTVWRYVPHARAWALRDVGRAAARTIGWHGRGTAHRSG